MGVRCRHGVQSERPGDLGPRPREEVRQPPRTRRARPGGRPGRGARFPRAQRRRQVHDAALPAGAAEDRRRYGERLRPRPVAGRRAHPPSTRVRPGGRGPVAEPQRRGDDRHADPDAWSQAGRVATGRAPGAVRAGPDQEGTRLLQGEPAEGRAGRRVRHRLRAADPGRADVRARPVDGADLQRVRRRAHGPWRHRPAVQPHPQRGRATRGPGDDHPRRTRDRDRRVEGHEAPAPQHRPGRGLLVAAGADRDTRGARRGGGRPPGELLGEPRRAVGRAHGPQLRGAGLADEHPALPRGALPRRLPHLADRRAGRLLLVMSTVVGTPPLVRYALRRDRVLAGVWLLVLVLTCYASAAATPGLYPTAREQVVAAEGINASPAIVALYGPILDVRSLGELAMTKMTVLYAVFVAVMFLILVRRHTRVEEENGQTELVGGTAVGRDAPLAAAVAEAALVAAVLGLLAAGVNVAAGLPVAGSLAFGASWAGVGLVAAAGTALACQFSASARTCAAIAAAGIGVAFGLRAVGDVAAPWL